MEKVLSAGRLPPALLQRLAQHYEMLTLPPADEQAAFLAAHAAGITGLVTLAATGVSEQVVRALPALRVISSFGVGLDKMPLEAARERGVAVGYTPDVLNDCVADMAFALLLDTARRVTEADRFVRQGQWRQGVFPLAKKVSGAKLGLVGLGRIGRTIAQRATGFEMPTRYHSRRAVPDVPWAHEPSLLALAEWADFLVVITAGGPATKHLINAPVLDALGADGVLVNVARGSVVDEAALVQALLQGRIGGAGLDVFEDEPKVPEALFGCDRVVLAPHIASATRETRQAMADLVFDNLADFYACGRVRVAA